MSVSKLFKNSVCAEHIFNAFYVAGFSILTVSERNRRF